MSSIEHIPTYKPLMDRYGVLYTKSEKLFGLGDVKQLTRQNNYSFYVCTYGRIAGVVTLVFSLGKPMENK